MTDKEKIKEFKDIVHYWQSQGKRGLRRKLRVANEELTRSTIKLERQVADPVPVPPDVMHMRASDVFPDYPVDIHSWLVPTEDLEPRE